MLPGYTGKMVRLDLTTGKIGYEFLDEEVARKYVGGAGLAAKIIWDETSSTTDPLSPENILIFMTGPLTASIVPSSSRCVVAGISPLTGIWGKASCGGSFAYELRHAEFDGIIVKGEAGKPIYLWVHDGKVEIRDAQHLWRKDTYEATELLKAETDKNASVACIGQAGEKLVRIACIMIDGKMGRAAARCGLGALMGAKRLKAVAVRGTLPIPFYGQDKLQENVNKIYSAYPPRKGEEVVSEAMAISKSYLSVGGYPVKNWREGTFEGAMKLAEDARKGKPRYCKGCPYSDGESLYTADGERHMVLEAWGPLGTNCLIDNPEAVQKAYSLCNRYGLDAISTGGVIAFVMECFEKGLITKNDTNAIELRWGNHEAMIEMVKKIGEGEGFGKILGEGVRKSAERIGGIAVEYAMHVKGLEIPAHDPRAAMGGALGYATGTIGAAHMEPVGIKAIENYSEGTAERTFPDLGYAKTLNRFTTEGKGVLAAKTQNFGVMLDSLVVCLFLGWRLQPSDFARLINCATGWDMDLDRFMLIGERIFNLIRMINVTRGISRKDDTLSTRFLSHKRGSGKSAESLPFLGMMLSEYYSYRGWSEEGIPTREKLIELGLEECL